MKLFNKVAIVGVGLIGGSLGLAIKKAKLAGKIVGISRREENLALAKKIGAIDDYSRKISFVSGADLIILSAPVNTILTLGTKIAKYVLPGAIISDVGSTKQQITSVLDRLFPNYVGAHPLAGSEKRGVKNSKPDLFNDSICILTPTRNTDEGALLKIRKLWSSIGAKVVLLPSNEHDKITAFISHLPHIAAFSLVNTVPYEYMSYCSSGFKDATRIAASGSELWSDIFLSNQENVLKAVDLFQNNLSKLRQAIVNKDRKSLDGILRKAKEKRERL